MTNSSTRKETFNKMNKKLIAIDLDGTTLNNQSLLSQKTVQTLQLLQEDGHHILIATGRPYRNSKHLYSELGLKSPMVNFNGALCHMPGSKNWSSYYHKTIDSNLVMDILAKQDDLGYNWLTIEGQETLYSSTVKIPPSEFFPANTLSTLVTSQSKLDGNPTSLNLYIDEARQEAIRQRLLDEYGSETLSVRTWGGSLPCLEIVAPGIQKAIGVDRVASYYNINRQDILAFGDEDNDFEMLDYAGHGVMMKNGIDRLRSVANDVTAFTNDEDGLALYLENYFSL